MFRFFSSLLMLLVRAIRRAVASLPSQVVLMPRSIGRGTGIVRTLILLRFASAGNRDPSRTPVVRGDAWTAKTWRGGWPRGVGLRPG
ncbi:MAG: hypothetical protein KF777_20730 [Planctomycetaceae bacterium]|nr:hypothetical protein [Planctomycetaceae bacterium]